jgi:hypothetical protein
MYATGGIISIGSYYRTPLPIIQDYHQWYTTSGSETASDGSYEPLPMTFSVVVFDCCSHYVMGKSD